MTNSNAFKYKEMNYYGKLALKTITLLKKDPYLIVHMYLLDANPVALKGVEVSIPLQFSNIFQ